MIKKLSNIIEGWINRFRKVHPVKEALFRDRLEICESNECGMMKLGICTACGCPIKSKTRSVDEVCPENMWNPVMYEYEGIQFMDYHDLPKEIWNSMLDWIEVNNVPAFTHEWTPCPSGVAWESWLKFKEYLRGI